MNGWTERNEIKINMNDLLGTGNSGRSRVYKGIWKDKSCAVKIERILSDERRWEQLTFIDQKYQLYLNLHHIYPHIVIEFLHIKIYIRFLNTWISGY